MIFNIAEGLLDVSATVLAITTNERSSTVDAQTLAQKCRVGLGTEQ